MNKAAIVGYRGDTPPNNNDIGAIARACHMANRAYCIALGDLSQPLWMDLDDETRDSASDGVCGVLNGNTPEQSHVSWLEFKGNCGWKYGPAKDVTAKLHPCMVPYGDLPEEQRLKDDLFIDTVHEVGRPFDWFAGTPAGRLDTEKRDRNADPVDTQG